MKKCSHDNNILLSSPTNNDGRHRQHHKMTLMTTKILSALVSMVNGLALGAWPHLQELEEWVWGKCV